MDRFASLEAFKATADEGSFAAAARDLGLSRSQVNKLVIQLEDHLGAQLFNRTTRQVSLTSTGRAFYDRALTILSDLAEAESQIQDDQGAPQGELKINAPMSFGTSHLGPALIDFMQLYPKIRIQLILDDRFIDPIADGFDMTIRIGEPVDMPSLIDHEIVEAKRVICAAPDFLKQHGHPKSPKDLLKLPCLHYGNLPTGNRWRLTGPDGSNDVQVNGVLCSNNADVLRDAAVKGLGLALLPTFVAGAELQAGRLVTVLSDFHAPTIHLCLLYPPNRHLASRMRVLVEFLYERFGDKPYWDLVT